MKPTVKSTKTKASKPKLNIRLLRKIQKHILEEPLRLDMAGFGHKIEHLTNDDPPCGTVGCIAGWALWLNGIDPSKTDTLVKASAILGFGSLWSIQGKSLPLRLFYVEEWPQRFARRYDAAKTARGRAGATAARIEHLITKGE